MNKKDIYPTILDRIKAKTIYVGECWIFTGTPSKVGSRAPIIRTGFGMQEVAAYIWEMEVGKPSGDNIVCHTCDNSRCWNLKHLYEGTYSTNNNDTILRNRGNRAFGSKQGLAVITDDIATDIKTRLKNGGRPSDIARKLNVPVYIIYNMKHENTWKHITV